MADSRLEFLFRLRHILRHTIPHGIGFRFQEMYLWRSHYQHIEFIVFPEKASLGNLRETFVGGVHFVLCLSAVILRQLVCYREVRTQVTVFVHLSGFAVGDAHGIVVQQDAGVVFAFDVDAA